MTITGTTRAALAFAAATISSGAAAADLKFAHVYETGSIYHEWAVWAADEIAKRSDGRHSVDVFPAASLGSENDLFEGLSIGSIDMTFTGSFYAGDIYGPMAISSAP